MLHNYLQRGRRLSQRLRAARGRRGAILLYHRVGEPAADPWDMAVSRSHFATQMEMVARRAPARKLSAFASWLGSSGGRARSIAITFDDGYADNVKTALPILEAHGLPATVFVVSGAIGTRDAFWWDLLTRVLLETPVLPEALTLTAGGQVRTWNLGAAACVMEETRAQACQWRADRSKPHGKRQELYLEVWTHLSALPFAARQEAIAEISAWAGHFDQPAGSDCPRPINQVELEHLARSPLIEIGGHTVSHPALATLPLEQEAEEIACGREALIEMTGQPVTSFAYPHGSFKESTMATVRRTGFVCAGCSQESLATPASDPFQLPRISVKNWPPEVFDRVLSDLLGD